MAKVDIPAIQDYLREQELDGWLIFDFRGQNYIATHFVELDEDSILTRRWFYFIPQKGDPALLVHKIERKNFPNPPAKLHFYVSWQELKDKLGQILTGNGKIAMEYSPDGAIPYVSCVDGGTLDIVRSLGVEVVTSANLVQYFQSRWSDEQLQTHITAAENLDRIKNEAFALIGKNIKHDESVNEYYVQKFILERLREAEMMTDEPPIVAVNANAGNPHYAPTPERFSPITKGDLVLIDLFGKKLTPNAIYADITWMGYVGESIPDKYAKIFAIVARGRDAGLDLLKEAASQGKSIQGWQVDEKTRSVIEEAGYGDYFDHRTGHSLDTNLHGNGVNIDNLETRDRREIIPGVGFTIEPGIYLDEFGVRSEINVFYSEKGPQVYGPIQTEIIGILKTK